MADVSVLDSGTKKATVTSRGYRLWIAYWCVLFVVMHIPTGGTNPVPVRHGDKLIHFVLYALLAWLGGRLVIQGKRSGTRRALLGWAVIYVVYAALDEGLQSFVGRTASVGDWLCDVGGVTAASAMLIIRRPGRKLSERHGIETGNVTRD